MIFHREVANVAFNDLPSARSGGGRHSCDVCNKNGVFLKAAKVFCTFCSLMYCAEHEKVRPYLFLCLQSANNFLGIYQCIELD